MITLIGAKGSMGRRYVSILNWMGRATRCFDKEDSMDSILGAVQDSSHVIIASPTGTHLTYLNELIKYNAHVLCEKPIYKDADLVEDVVNRYKASGKSLTMMMQYTELVSCYDKGKPTKYDYFRTGPDGLYWDCLQIIGLARGPVEIANKSPIWECMINGDKLSVADMDKAYIRFLSRWLHGDSTQTPDDIINAHYRVEQFFAESHL